jgi:hypothetical protein
MQIRNTGLEFIKLLSFQGRKEEKEEEAQEARKGGRGRRGGGGEEWGGGEEGQENSHCGRGLCQVRCEYCLCHL